MIKHILTPRKKGGKLSGPELSLSWDTNDINNKNKVAVIFYKPNPNEHIHYHIELTDKQIEEVGKWIEDYLKMKRGRE